MVRRILGGFAMLVVAVVLVGCAHTGSPTAPPMPDMPAYGADGTPQVFEGMGPHSRRVTTESEEAQTYFDQGIAWLHSFNHDEAVRSFTAATEADPGCAMAWWGNARPRHG